MKKTKKTKTMRTKAKAKRRKRAAPKSAENAVTTSVATGDPATDVDASDAGTGLHEVEEDDQV